MSNLVLGQLIPKVDATLSSGLQWIIIIVVLILIVILIALLLLIARGLILRKCKPNERLVIERFGKFLKLRSPGLTLLRPFVDHVRHVLLGVQRFEVKEKVRTKEGYFVAMHIMVHGQVIGGEEAIQASAQGNADPAELQKNILLYLYSGDVLHIVADLLSDYLRTKVAGRNYDSIFEEKEAIADEITKHLAGVLAKYGFQILRTPITDIDPGAEIQHAANQALVEQRNKLAVITRAEGEAEAIITRAKADCVVDENEGQGAQRRLIEQARGLLEAFKLFLGDEVIFSPEGVAAILLEMERLNALNSFAQSGGTHAIVVPNNSGLSDEVVGVASAIIAGDTAQEKGGFNLEEFDEHMTDAIAELRGADQGHAADALQAQKGVLKNAFLGIRSGIVREIAERTHRIPIAGKRIAKVVGAAPVAEQ